MAPRLLLVSAVYTLLQISPQNGIERLMEYSILSVLIAVFALLIMVAVGYTAFLFGFVRLITRR